MCSTTSLLAVVVLGGTAALALPQFGPPGNAPSTGGSGPYPAGYSTDAALPDHTVYLPQEVPSDVSLPVLIWGEGGCQANGLMFEPFLTEIASHGFFIIASGKPNGSGQTTSAMMTEAVDWISSDAGKNTYGFVEPSRVSVAGQSCGGVEAYDLADDERVTSIGIFNSGLLDATRSQTLVPTINKPIFYFIGGSDDIAYANAERDYQLLPADTPSWKGNMAVGHGGTYSDVNGGKFAVAATRFLQWTLQGNATAAEFFTGGGASEAGWTVESMNLDKINVA